MYGNAPYANQQTDTADAPDPEAVERLRRDTEGVAARTRALLTDEFIVGSNLQAGLEGPQGTVSVQPPIGDPIRAGIAADATDEERDGLATELAAGAAMQVKRAVNDVSPTAG